MNKNTESNQSNPPAGFKTPTLIIFIILIFAFGIVSAFNPLGLAGLPLSIVAAAMAVTLALSFGDDRKKASVPFAVGLLSYVVSAVLYAALTTASETVIVVYSLMALFPTLLALPIYLTVRGKMGRAVSIAAAGITSALFFILYYALSIYSEYGALTIQAVNQNLDAAFEPVKIALSSLSYEKSGETVAYYNASEIETLLYTMKTMLIGALAAAMIVMSYVVTLVCRFIAASFDITGLFPVGYRITLRRIATDDGPAVEMYREQVQWRIQLDNVTAGIFLAAYAVALLFSSSSGASLPMAITAQNLIVILMPGFIYAGGRDLLLGFSGGGGMLPRGSINPRGCIFIVFAVVLVFINPLTLLLLLSAAGVVSTFRENHRRSLSDKNRKE